ncbi:MAG: O-antigen ligase family protein [Lachnospiraceae bacterium]|nr:O-antigen ligase family protein [Lachnospiraceae bacterium]
MQQKIRKIIRLLVNIYLLLLLVVLPLYMEDGMIQIGNVKYYFFRNRTLLFVILISVCGLFVLKSCRWTWSWVDIAVLAFAAASLLSFCLSSDKQTAFWGYEGWYMGLFSQLLFVWIYFAVSRGYDGEEYVWILAAAGAAVVFALGILNRMGFDPLGIYDGVKGIGVYAMLDDGNWVYHHMLSTIGNENWYCGYASVTSGICLYYGYSQTGWKKIVGLTGTLISFMTLVTQGSETAYFVILLMLLVLLMVSLDQRKNFMSFLDVVLMLPLACVLLQIYGSVSAAGLRMNDDSSLKDFVLWKGWGTVLIFFLILLAVEMIRERKNKTDLIAGKPLRKAAAVSLVCGVIIAVVLLILCQVSDPVWGVFHNNGYLRFSYSWGSYRGGLWYMAIFSWLHGGFKNILFGVGPDCFANAVYGTFNVGEIISDVVIYANAHNEWLNMLVNEGVFGAVSYVSIFLCAFFRIWKNRAGKGILLAALLAIGGYLANGMFSFQQTVSTPLIFAVLGMAEAQIRIGKK